MATPAPIYLDYASTTPLDPDVLEAMLPYLRDDFANPASLHSYGQRARAAIEGAREQVAASIGAAPKEIIFCSGATEADNHALRLAMAGSSQQLVTSPLEHAAVLRTAKQLETEGYPVHWLPTTAQGETPLEGLKAALSQPTRLIALMLVNNETGIINPIAEVTAHSKAAGAWVFCDAVQAFGVLPIDVQALGVDMLSLSAHKVYGPKGVGVLWLRQDLPASPLLHGGEQERGLRAGTHNVAAIVGMGKAAELAQARLDEYRQTLAQQRAWLRDALLSHEGVQLNTGDAACSPKHLNIHVDGVDGEAMLFMLDQAGIAVSAGSACSAGSIEASHVLLAMGRSRNEAKASLRFSLGRGLHQTMLEHVAARFGQVLARCRAFSDI